MTERQERLIGVALVLAGIALIIAWHTWDMTRAYFIVLSIGVEVGLAVLAVPLGIVWLVRRIKRQSPRRPS